MMVKKICFIDVYSQYEAKSYFVEKFAEAMRRHGLETMIYKPWETLQQGNIQKFQPDLLCSFNGPTETEGQKFSEGLKIPHLSILYEPSFYSTFLLTSPYSLIACSDWSDCASLAGHGFDKAFFLPQAVESELATNGNSNRDYDVVFTGSCFDYESLRLVWQERFSKEIGRVLDDAAEIVFSDESLSLAEALVQAWNMAQLDPEDADFVTLYLYLDCYTRGKDRVELIRSIKNAKVHVFGDHAQHNPVNILNWQDYVGNQTNVTVHPAVSYKEALEIFKRSKIVLNSMPFSRDGSQERVVAALACGAVPISSKSKYLQEQFQAGKNIQFYHASNREAVNGYIENWLGDETKRQGAAMDGRALVMKNHTWDARVKELLERLPRILENVYNKQL